MITKERLEELRKENKTIWCVYNNNIEELNAKDFDEKWFGYDWIYEDKDDAYFDSSNKNENKTC